jgi:hypothetical protein
MMNIYGYEVKEVREFSKETYTEYKVITINGKEKVYEETKNKKMDRVIVSFDGYTIAKFDRTKEDLEEMTESLLEWALEDGTIKSHARKRLYPEMLKEVMANFGK